MGTPTRKMVEMVWAIPSITAVWIAGGSLWMAAGLSLFRLTPAGTAVRWSARRMLPRTRLA